MDKYLFIGISVAVLIFLSYLGINIGPFLLLVIVTGVLFVLITNKKGSLTALNTDKNSKKGALSNVNVKFEDIGGLSRVKKELTEALDFLIYQDKYKNYDIRPIKGILLAGPPGTGKTLLAKAAANYTDSIFVAASGSEFVEMYVGVGAQRVRKLFNEAKSLAQKNNKTSAIIFIDEIDAIGGKREGKSQREYDQTLNQLLTEMDGVKANENPRILIMAATNRIDMLDTALIRPGRFDRHITVDLPDKIARRKILDIHTQKKPLADDIDLDEFAAETYGLSGAQLESVANEAAIYAFRDAHEKIAAKHFSNAIDKVLMGEQMDREATKEEKRRVAIHELGHAIVAEAVRPESVSQVALRPRGQALGYVRHNPKEDRYLQTKESIEEQIMVALGGAVAEEIFYQGRSTGSRNDFEQALKMVNVMIESGLTSLGIVNTDYIAKEKMVHESETILNLLLNNTKNLLQLHVQVIEKALQHLEKEEVLSGQEFRELINKYSLSETIAK